MLHPLIPDMEPAALAVAWPRHAPALPALPNAGRYGGWCVIPPPWASGSRPQELRIRKMTPSSIFRWFTRLRPFALGGSNSKITAQFAPLNPAMGWLSTLSSPTRRPSLGPWLGLIALGLFHGLNPAMGWLFSVLPSSSPPPASSPWGTSSPSW